MSKFKDNEGREYVLSLNVAAVKKIKEKTGVDLINLDSMPGQLSDVYKLFDVLWMLIEGQNDVTPEEFGAAMAGDSIEAATDALLQMVVDFFPGRRREVLNTCLEKAKVLNETMLDHAAAQVEKLNVGDLSGLAQPS